MNQFNLKSVLSMAVPSQFGDTWVVLDALIIVEMKLLTYHVINTTFSFHHKKEVCKSDNFWLRNKHFDKMMCNKVKSLIFQHCPNKITY